MTGPVCVESAMPGDVLKVEVLDLQPGVPYGVISNRFPLNPFAGIMGVTPNTEESRSSVSPARIGGNPDRQ